MASKLYSIEAVLEVPAEQVGDGGAWSPQSKLASAILDHITAEPNLTARSVLVRAIDEATEQSMVVGAALAAGFTPKDMSPPKIEAEAAAP